MGEGGAEEVVKKRPVAMAVGFGMEGWGMLVLTRTTQVGSTDWGTGGMEARGKGKGFKICALLSSNGGLAKGQ